MVMVISPVAYAALMSSLALAKILPHEPRLVEDVMQEKPKEDGPPELHGNRHQRRAAAKQAKKNAGKRNA
jgi:hypothetical protein